MFGGLQTWLEHKKSYIISAVLVAVGAVTFLGIPIPYVEVSGNGIDLILEGLGLSALRAGIAKVAG